MSKIFNVCNTPQGAEILVYGVIEAMPFFEFEVGSKEIKQQLQAYSGKPVCVRINSPGGDFFTAAAIYTGLREHDGFVTVKIDGLAASAAAFIALAGKEVQISPVAEIMIHNSLMALSGNSENLKTAIERLTAIDDVMACAISEKTGIDKKSALNLMSAETWYSAKEAVKAGFADKIIDLDGEKKQAVRAVACTCLENALEQMERDTAALAEREERRRILAENEDVRKRFL